METFANRSIWNKCIGPGTTPEEDQRRCLGISWNHWVRDLCGYRYSACCLWRSMAHTLRTWGCRYRSARQSIGFSDSCCGLCWSIAFIGGFFIVTGTFAVYQSKWGWLSQFMLHSRYLPDHRVAITTHFLLHGISHYLPMDKGRLVKPPALILVFAAPLYWLTHLLFFWSWHAATATFCGALSGYLYFEVFHYFLHNRPLDKPPPKFL